MSHLAPIAVLTVLVLQFPSTAQKKGVEEAPAKKATKTDNKPPAKTVKVDGYAISIKTVKPQPIVSIRIQCKVPELAAKFGEYLPKLFGYAAQSKGQIAGQPLAIYHSYSTKVGTVDVEMACPLKKPIKGKGEIKAGMLFGSKVAVTFHLGAYQELGNAHAAMKKWLEASKHESGGAPWEVYTSDPTQVKPSELRTDVFYPLQRPKPKTAAKTRKKAKVDK